MSHRTETEIEVENLFPFLFLSVAVFWGSQDRTETECRANEFILHISKISIVRVVCFPQKGKIILNGLQYDAAKKIF